MTIYTPTNTSILLDTQKHTQNHWQKALTAVRQARRHARLKRDFSPEGEATDAGSEAASALWSNFNIHFFKPIFPFKLG